MDECANVIQRHYKTLTDVIEETMVLDLVMKTQLFIVKNLEIHLMLLHVFCVGFVSLSILFPCFLKLTFHTFPNSFISVHLNVFNFKKIISDQDHYHQW